MLTLTEVLKHYPTKQAVATALGISKAAVSQWPIDGPIPEFQEMRLRYEVAPEIFGRDNAA